VPANRRARPALKPTVRLFIRIGRVLLAARRRVPELPPFEIIEEHVSGAVEEG